MKNNNEQHWEPLWWTKKPAYIAFFVREISGLLIAIYILYLFIVSAYPSYLQTPEILKNIATPIQIIGLIGALIHTLTWLGVMPKILPLTLTEKQEKTATILIFAFWLIFSFFLFKLIYAY
jgi:fumarate reductase subunit C